ncbi:MAG: FAD-binding oxidoreductase [Gammaproteobacteria bacterium]|nr:FAD-binding oxidoreductase [Gammaproteobacteria bacterium]MDH5241134.1 FAD-binding oxidoreductase [Gammaproteobacteria bacterium]MDH5583571.1 FAD-binding oxidoreductase [Gammaproteobacteria bacterium]
MKKPSGKISRRDLMMGSTAVGGLALLGTPGFSFAQAAAAASAAPSSNLDDLAGLLRGDLILPHHDGYDEARKVWNGMIDKHPAAIARCSGAADVMDVVKYAREKGIPVSVRGGGHNVAGKALKDGAITIDLGGMHGVRVDAAKKRARVQGGAKWAAVDRETLAFDLVTTGGTVSATGVGGLTLGGGLGWIMRKHGLSCDNVMSADVVTADGRLLVANKNENSDLYWAIRGGGGNFGVVTSFEFKLHDLEPITGGMAMYPQSMLKDMFHFYRDYTSKAPDSVSAGAGVIVGPPGTALEGQSAGVIIVCHKGPAGDGERLVKPIKDFGPPALDFIGPTTYKAQQSLFDAGSPPGLRNYWRSNMMTELSDAAIDALVARAGELPPPASMIFVEHMGGAVGRVGAHDTAFSNRHAQYNTSVFGTWVNADEDERNIAWVRTFGDELRKFATGGAYVNYMAADEAAGNIKAAYDANFKRLTEVKRKYDPTNFFSGNQNITP